MKAAIPSVTWSREETKGREIALGSIIIIIIKAMLLMLLVVLIQGALPRNINYIPQISRRRRRQRRHDVVVDGGPKNCAQLVRLSQSDSELHIIIC